MLLLAGDFGGTKTDLALYSTEGGPRKGLAQAEFHSASYPSLEAIAKDFLANIGQSVDRACFGVAGPVIAGHAKITNLPWDIDEATSRQELGMTSVRPPERPGGDRPRRAHLDARRRTHAQSRCASCWWNYRGHRAGHR